MVCRPSSKDSDPCGRRWGEFGEDRRVTPDEARQELLRLRSSIDNLDAALVHLLAERFKCTEQVGRLKANAGMPPADPAREAVQIARLRALSETSGLDPHFAEKFLNVIIAEVIQNHRQFTDE